MIFTLDTSEFDKLIFGLQDCEQQAGKLQNQYGNLVSETDEHLNSLDQFNEEVAKFEEEEVEALNEEFSKFEEMISEYNKQVDDIRNEFHQTKETEMAVKKLSINIIKCEKYLVTLKMKFMTMSMQQKHEIKKHFIEETYKNKMKDMKNEISVKTDNLKKMLKGVDEILQNWKDIQKETEVELDKKSTYLGVYKNEIKQIDYQIELEEQKIKELKEELDKKKELDSNEFKSKLDEIDQLEHKKSDLKNHNNEILDNIEGLEDKKEELEGELHQLKQKILKNVKLKKNLKDREISERKKQSEIKDYLYEKKRKMDSLRDDATTKTKEVQELKKLLSSQPYESKDLDNASMERYLEDELEQSVNVSNIKQIEKQILEFFGDFESNPKKHSITKISEREYQAGSHTLYPVLKNGRVMIKTPNGSMSLYEFYQKYLDKDHNESKDNLISDQKEPERHFIFSGQQFELSNDVNDNSRSMHSQFEVNEGDDEEDKIEFEIEGDTKNDKVSFLESIGSEDSYLLMSKNKNFKSPVHQNDFIGESGEKIKQSTGSPLMNKKDKQAPPKSTKIPKKTKSKLADLILRNEKANKHF